MNVGALVIIRVLVEVSDDAKDPLSDARVEIDQKMARQRLDVVNVVSVQERREQRREKVRLK